MWSDVENKWLPKPIPIIYGGLRSEYFIENGTWVCPENVYNIIVFGCGGGGSGSGGSGDNGFGGGGAIQQVSYISVVPGQEYTIIIGQGGSKANGSVFYDIPEQGNNGQSTIFKLGNIVLFSAIGAAMGGHPSYGSNFERPYYDINFVKMAANGAKNNESGYNNYINTYNPGLYNGGGAGPQGNGGSGGFPGNSEHLNGFDGQDALPNTGAGGSGYLRVVF